MPFTPLDLARLDDLDRSLGEVDAPLKKLRQSAFGAQGASLDAIEKALTAAAQLSKSFRQDVKEKDEARRLADEKSERLEKELKAATLARLAAETETANRDALVKKQAQQLDDAALELTQARQAADQERIANESRVKTLNAQIELAGDHIAKLRGELDDARAKLDGKGRPQMAIQDVLSALGTQLSSVNAASPSSEQPFAGQFVVERLEVELKGGINLESGVSVVPPQGADLTPENASTIRFSIRPSVNLRVVDAE
ncbi:MAG: hypothetical protein U0572_02440 [Phycisphaerales bacterium]